MLILAGPVLMAAEGSNGLSLDTLIQYGVLGIVLVAILGGFLWAKPAVDQLKADKEAAEKQRDALIETYEKQVIPVLSEVQRELVPALKSASSQLKSAGEELVKLQKQVTEGLETVKAMVEKGRA